MKRLRQTVAGGFDENGTPTGNCLPACLASMLDLPSPDVLPNFVTWPADDDWWDRVNAWLHDELGVFMLDWPVEDLGWTEDAWGHHGLWKAAVPSLNLPPDPETGIARNHAVVMRRNRLAWDPSTGKRYESVGLSDLRFVTVLQLTNAAVYRRAHARLSEGVR